MIRVIIIDDEVLVRLGIKTYLDNYKDVISVENTFSSAIQGLEYMEHNAVDIVLTDIEMADMDGISYIKKVKELNYLCGIIVLSCHDDFEYAREALSLGADQYMLKHEVCEDVLVDTIKDLYQKVQGKNKIQKSSQTQWISDFNKMKLNHDPCNDDFSYGVGVIKLYIPYDKNDKRIAYDVDEIMLFHLIEELMEKNENGTVFIQRNKAIFVVFHFPNTLNKEEIEYRIREIYEGLDKNIVNYVNHHITMGVSSIFNKMTDIKMYYEQAKECETYQFYQDTGQIFMFDYSKTMESKKPLLELKMEGFLEKDWPNQLELLMKEYINICRILKSDPIKVKVELDKQIHIFLNKILQFYNLEENENDYTITYLQIDELENADVLCRWLVEKLLTFREYIIDHLNSSDDFSSILNYIEERYNKNISLAEVAGQFYMSTNYFCQVFKNNTGYTFVNYLNQLKVTKVKQLLQQKNYSLEQISELTGFSNVNYMSRVFKKTEGKTIGEYRILIK